MGFHVPEKHRVDKYGRRYSQKEHIKQSALLGNNGWFRKDNFKIVASDQGGWEHVSISNAFGELCPTWNEMCEIKDLFWDDGDCVMQLHPPKKDYVNISATCLHLWRPTEKEIPTPPKDYV